MRKFCANCGKFEEDLCKHSWVEVPDKCKCASLEWSAVASGKGAIPPICEKYEGDGTTNCSNCEHDKECHE